MLSLKTCSCTKLKVLALCVLLSGTLALAQEAKPVKLFLLGGQSNMEGCGKSSELPEPFKTHPANVKIWDNKEKRWVTLGQ
ncbi:MAG: sialate O-acetylesterase, partial [Planctomycetes bacterium]|nr:sialate O-acetylesterase [Planctomycetota bacterium]